MNIFNKEDLSLVFGWSLEAIFLLIIVCFVFNEVYRWSVRIKGLPGPVGLPIIGNLHQIDGVPPSEIYRQWSFTYGSLFQVQLGNVPVLIINSAAVAKDLLIRESSSFNSRPLFYIFHRFVSEQVTSIGTSPWDESCKRRRKAAASALNVVQVDSYAPILRLESSEFIKELRNACDSRNEPIDVSPFVRRVSMNLSLTLNYGTRAASQKDFSGNPLLSEIMYVESQVSRYRSTSTNFKNYIPFLRVPDILPINLGSCNPLHKALDIGERRLRYHRVLLEQLKARIGRKTDIPCIQGNLLKDPDTRNLSEAELLSISLSIMAGASSNTPTLTWGILFFAHHQGIQEKAFQEIRASHVLDSDSFGNGKVPYVEAFTREVSRYYTVLRLAMPKAVTAPVKYKGVIIPKGTMVLLNAWACNRDSNIFERPFEFIPERWLENKDTQPHQFAFGMGTHVCCIPSGGQSYMPGIPAFDCALQDPPCGSQ